MKTILKIIALVIVACIVLSLLSSMPSLDDFKSEIKSFLSIDTDEMKGDLKEKVFYNTAGDKVVEIENIAAIADGTRGFFVKGNNVYYCIKSSGHSERSVYIDSDDLTYGGYEYCYYVTSDMVTFRNYSDNFSANFTGDSLIVYLAVSGLDKEEAIDLSDKLLANQPVNINYLDPVSPEGPGAE